jgi:hypothetical protein
LNQDLALDVLSQIMNWPDDRARKEFQWLRLMARLKYDGYGDFQAGLRFIESLATWLQQFKKPDRETAYHFVRHTLVYIGPREMQRLVEQFYPRIVFERLMRTVAREMGLPTYMVLADSGAHEAIRRLRRQTLFMGSSDGARIDVIRHMNAGLLSNEQLVQGIQVNKDKWKDLRDSLRKDLQDPTAHFRLVYLIDDFTATGTTFLRYDEENAKWKGKLAHFRDSLRSANADLDGDGPFAPEWELCVHHYAASKAAVDGLDKRLALAASEFADERWAHHTHTSYGTILPPDLPIDSVPERNDAFIKLAQDTYDPIIETKHTAVGGVKNIALGYGGCALPLVLDHNTPNNSIALLWAETDGGVRDGIMAPPMRPLFRRRQRHG